MGRRCGPSTKGIEVKGTSAEVRVIKWVDVVVLLPKVLKLRELVL